jgi:hypothetical protein
MNCLYGEWKIIKSSSWITIWNEAVGTVTVLPDTEEYEANQIVKAHNNMLDLLQKAYEEEREMENKES